MWRVPIRRVREVAHNPQITKHIMWAVVLTIWIALICNLTVNIYMTDPGVNGIGPLRLGNHPNVTEVRIGTAGQIIVNNTDGTLSITFGEDTTITVPSPGKIRLIAPNGLELNGFTISATSRSVIPCTDDTTSPTTGALRVDGGVGIAKAVNVGGSITTGVGVFLPTAGSTAAAMNYYSEDTIVATWSGAIPATAGNVRYTRLGTVIYLTLPQTLATATAVDNIVLDVVLPVELRPTTSPIFIPLRVRDNGGLNQLTGYIQINTNGNVFIGKDANMLVFTGAGSTGFFHCTCTYSIV
jgi:hypothetical protein